ncbi:MAG TPA: acyl-ACP--UDP-N-acetylglucosamine O-acyltransferase [Steroidobacteraceae bacterium]|nr:acyl-ACP--UDP-N-acetylglucosamine O-acyltransferase [Steroidobacteraceae bacterium]
MIDPRAAIASGAQLGPGVSVGPFSVIGPEVVIGAGCAIASHAVITGRTTLGSGNKVLQFASIGDAPQDKKYAGEPTRLEIGDRNIFRECCTVNRGTVQDQGVTRIGSDNLFMAYTHVAHDCIVGSQVVMANYCTLGGHVQLGDWAILGGYSGVHQFCKIGAHAFIANNTGVTRDVPPFVMAVGQPAVPHSINSEGLKRRGFTPEQIQRLKQAYRILYRSDLLLADAVTQLQALAPDAPEIRQLLDFIASSGRSLIR